MKRGPYKKSGKPRKPYTKSGKPRKPSKPYKRRARELGLVANSESPVTRDRYALALAIKHQDWGKAMEFVKVCPYCHGWHVALGLDTDFCCVPCAKKQWSADYHKRKKEPEAATRLWCCAGCDHNFEAPPRTAECPKCGGELFTEGLEIAIKTAGKDTT